MGEFNASEGEGRGAEGLQTEHRHTALLDRAMILLDDVVEVAARAYLDGTPAPIFLAEQTQASMSRGVPIEIDLGRPANICSGDGRPEKFLRGLDGTVLTKQ
jgi:hypothetical protein